MADGTGVRPLSAGPIGRPLLTAPAALWIAVFTLAPFVLLVAVSFWTSGYYGTRPDFVWINYARIFQNELYGLQLLKTLRIALVSRRLSNGGLHSSRATALEIPCGGGNGTLS